MTPLLQPAGCSVLVIDPREEHLGRLQPHQQKVVARGLQLVEQAVQAAAVPIHLALPGVPDPEHSIVTFGSAAPPRIHDLGDSGSSWSHSGLATALAAQGRPSLVLCGFWLETTVTFIALPALASGFDVFVLMDAAPALADDARDPAAHRLTVLSPVELDGLPGYDGPTWLDRAVVAREPIAAAPIGFGGELDRALGERRRWLIEQRLAELRPSGELVPKPEMTTLLRQREQAQIASTLSRQLNWAYLPHEPGARVSGVYERAVPTPSGKLAVIRREDTFTLAPWKPTLEPMRGRAVMGLVGPHRVTWTLDRGRGLPGRG